MLLAVLSRFGSIGTGLVWTWSFPFLRIPRIYSPPSGRQYLATPENASQRHLIFTFEPTLMGIFTRMHAPEGDLSSNLASASCEVPFWSSHDTSAIAKRAVLSSALFPLMLGMIGKKSKDLTSYLSAVIDLNRVRKTPPAFSQRWS